MAGDFGVHEALDQFGALFGPLLLALRLATHHDDYKLAFASLAVPGAITLSLVVVARLLYPKPETLEGVTAQVTTEGLPRVFWVYLAAAGLVGAGFADFPLVAYHLEQAHTVQVPLVPVFYAAAMAVSGVGSLVFGRTYDRLGIRVLIPLTIVAAVYAPLVFLGGFWTSLVGVSLWGLGMGLQESIIPAAVAPMVTSRRRASAYGLFTSAYGVAWFLGSTAIGAHSSACRLASRLPSRSSCNSPQYHCSSRYDARSRHHRRPLDSTRDPTIARWTAGQYAPRTMCIGGHMEQPGSG